MWQEDLRRLRGQYPDAFRLRRPASHEQIVMAENRLGLRLGDLDRDWPGFLKFSNGAAILGHWLLPATPGSQMQDIASENRPLWDLECYQWLKEHFAAFLTEVSSMRIGFVRKGSHSRCVAYLSEPTDRVALPIASSFSCFPNGLLRDAEQVLNARVLAVEEQWPDCISHTWPLDLKPWLDRDPELRRMLQQGALDDLFRADPEYSSLVDDALRG